MAFMGLYTSKEVEEIKLEHKRLGHKEAEDKYEKEIKEIMDMNEKIIDNQSKNNLSLREDLKDMKGSLLKLSKELKDKDREINVLRFLLAAEADKEVKRLEAIAKRTRKTRIKKKCESRIIDYKMRKLSYEKATE